MNERSERKPFSQLALTGSRAVFRTVAFWLVSATTAAATIGYLLPAHRVDDDLELHSHYADGGAGPLVLMALAAAGVFLLRGKRFGAGIIAGAVAMGCAVCGVAPILLVHMFASVENAPGDAVFAIGIVGSFFAGAAFIIAEPLLYLLERKQLEKRARAALPQLPVARAGLADRARYEQPLVLPQLGHLWQAPLRTISVPHSWHGGASVS